MLADLPSKRMILFRNINRCGCKSLLQRERNLKMSNVNKLRGEHAKLAVIVGQLSGIIAQDTPAPAQELYPIRMRLASELIKHLKSEDWILYPKLLASRNQGVALTAKAFSASMGGLASQFKTYCERWDSDAIMHNWARYQAETFEILRFLTLRMSREERDLYPLLDSPVRAAA